MAERIYLYDSTLRDGSQAQGIDFTVADKLAIAQALDAFGIDYIEGGWPGANPTDDAFFAQVPKTRFARVSAFGMTRRAGRSASNDPGLQDILNANTSTVCLVGKSWDWQVETALKISTAENLKMIGDSLSNMIAQGREAHFDAEHFFDGYKANPAYALEAVTAAYEAGAEWIILCDTNGGSMPSEVYRIVSDVKAKLPDAKLGIHCHNDTEQAVANSLAAVEAGVRQIQGTINGIGERCGNANLIALIPTLMLKMGFETGTSMEQLKEIGSLSRLIDDRLNRVPNRHAAYVGKSAFAHKGGLHVSAMARDSRSYEHIDPALVGNTRLILVSDKAGKANVLNRLEQMGIEVAADDERVGELVRIIKEREAMGYAYEDASASFELLARELLGQLPRYYELLSYRALNECRVETSGGQDTLAEATVKLSVAGETVMTVAEGNGPVNALDAALRKALTPHYPQLKAMHLSDYKVRILTPSDATAALTRVVIESRDTDGHAWHTLGVSPNVIDASNDALFDAVTWFLLRQNAVASKA